MTECLYYIILIFEDFDKVYILLYIIIARLMEQNYYIIRWIILSHLHTRVFAKHKNLIKINRNSKLYNQKFIGELT